MGRGVRRSPAQDLPGEVGRFGEVGRVRRLDAQDALDHMRLVWPPGGEFSSIRKQRVVDLSGEQDVVGFAQLFVGGAQLDHVCG